MKISDKVIYIGPDMTYVQGSREYNLKKYEEFKIVNIVSGLYRFGVTKTVSGSTGFHTDKSFIVQKKSGNICPIWLKESNFISLIEYRKLKLDKIKNVDC